jgi:hypothetical protein
MGQDILSFLSGNRRGAQLWVSECLPYVWGNELSNDGVFQSLEEAQKVLNLALRHWHTIAGTLNKGPQAGFVRR